MAHRAHDKHGGPSRRAAHANSQHDPAPGAHSDDEQAADASSAESSAESAEQSSSALGMLFAVLLWLLHFGFRCTLVWRSVRDEYRRAKILGARATGRQCCRPLAQRMRAWCSDARQRASAPVALRASDYSKLPTHMAFAFAEEQLKRSLSAKIVTAAVSSITSAGAACSSDASSATAHRSTTVGASSSDASIVAAQLIATCVQLPIPELTLFDAKDVLSSCWPSVGVQLARMHSAAAAASAAPILVLQGPCADDVDPASDADDAASAAAFIFPSSSGLARLPRAGEVLLVHEGLVALVSASRFLVPAGSAPEDQDPDAVDLVVDTSRPGVAFIPPPASPLPSDPDTRWRTRVARFVAARVRRPRGAAAPTAAQVRLLSFLGPKHHGQEAVARAVLRRAQEGAAAAPSSSATPAPTAAAPLSSHDLRLSLQRGVLPLCVSEPDLLVVVNPSHRRGERTVLGFPSWLLRVVEIMFASSVDELTHGDEMQLRLHDFARTVQRGGT